MLCPESIDHVFFPNDLLNVCVSDTLRSRGDKMSGEKIRPVSGCSFAECDGELLVFFFFFFFVWKL